MDVSIHPNLWLNLGADFVDAQETVRNTPLPRIPPLRGKIGVDVDYGGFRLTPQTDPREPAASDLYPRSAHSRLCRCEPESFLYDYSAAPSASILGECLQHRRPPLPQPLVVYQGTSRPKSAVVCGSPTPCVSSRGLPDPAWQERLRSACSARMQSSPLISHSAGGWYTGIIGS